MVASMNIAALYVDPRGPYPALGVDCWDEQRDARLYSGPSRVIAHPPCGPWGNLSAFSHGAGKDCGPIAVDQVRRFGGVLEHPAHSKLWKVCGLPPPFDLFGDGYGFTIQLYQGAHGHSCPKLTWLYAVGLKPCPLRHGWGEQRGRVELQSSNVRHFTPVQLAAALVAWVQS